LADLGRMRVRQANQKTDDGGRPSVCPPISVIRASSSCLKWLL
jgi:hypothetical protein